MPVYSGAARELSGQLPRRCRFCGSPLDQGQFICPCRRLAVSQVRRRTRPARVEVTRIQAEGLLKEYIITRNDIDGALNCTCPSFEEQNNDELHGGGHPEIPFGFCKHILQLPAEVLRESIGKFETWKTQNGGIVIPPSVTQKAMLYPFKVKLHDRLSTNQAYFLIGDALKRQGIEFQEFETILMSRGAISILPKLIFGVEIECYYPVAVGQPGIVSKMSDSGINIASQTYNHNLCKDWKIVSDGSLNQPPGGYAGQEVVSPPLYGSYGFQQLERVLRVLNEAECKVNKTCGLHVHLNAQLIPNGALVELMKVWMVIEKRFIWGLIPPSRREAAYTDSQGRNLRGGTYCRAVTQRHFRRCINEGPRAFSAHTDDHYMSLGFGALGRHGSVEIRSAAGTTQFDKIKNWVVMLLKLFDAVWAEKKGAEDFSRLQSVEDFLDAINMTTATGTSQLVKARNWAIDRFRRQWKWHEHPTFLEEISRESTPEERMALVEENPESGDGNVSRAEAGGQSQGAEAAADGEQRRIQTAIERRYNARQRREFTQFDPELPVNSVHNLVSKRLARKVAFDLICAMPNLEAEPREWRIPSRSNPNRIHSVIHNSTNDTLSCSCPAFHRRRNGQYCSHAASIARYLHIERQVRGSFRRQQCAE